MKIGVNFNHKNRCLNKMIPKAVELIKTYKLRSKIRNQKVTKIAKN